MSDYPGRPYRKVSVNDLPAFGKDIPQSKKIKSDLEEWLTSNVVEPSAKAGYPNIGAAAATVPSTLAEFMMPENTREFAPGMAGVTKLGRKAGGLSHKYLKNVGMTPDLDRNKYRKAYEDVQDLLEKSGVNDKVRKAQEKYMVGGLIPRETAENPLFKQLTESIEKKHTPKEIMDLSEEVKKADIHTLDPYNKKYKAIQLRNDLKRVENKIDEINYRRDGRGSSWQWQPEYLDKLKELNIKKRELSEELIKLLEKK